VVDLQVLFEITTHLGSNGIIIIIINNNNNNKYV